MGAISWFLTITMTGSTGERFQAVEEQVVKFLVKISVVTDIVFGRILGDPIVKNFQSNLD